MDKGTVSCIVEGCGKKIYVDSLSTKDKKWVEGLFIKFNVDSFDKLHAIYKCRSCLKKERLGISTQVQKSPLELGAEDVEKFAKGKISKEEFEKLHPVLEEPQTESFIPTENLSKLIPQICSKYIPRSINGINDIEMMERAYQSKIPLLLEGETGTGKTHAVRFFCFKSKLPYARVNLNGATTPEDLVGQWVPFNGSFKWQDGLLTRFMRNGGVFVVDEINSCPADILFILHSVLDDEKRLVLTQKDGEIIKAHQNFWLVSTMNPDYEGTKQLNKALRDRFRVVKYDYENRIEKKLIDNPKLLDFAKSLRSMYAKGEISFPCSTRMLLQFEQDKQIFDNETAQMFFINKYPLEEQKAIETAMEAYIGKVSHSEVEKLQEKEFDENE